MVELYDYDEVPFDGATGVRVDGVTVAVARDRSLAEDLALALGRPRYATVSGELWRFTEDGYRGVLAAISENQMFRYEQFGKRVSGRVEQLNSMSRERARKLLSGEGER